MYVENVLIIAGRLHHFLISKLSLPINWLEWEVSTYKTHSSFHYTSRNYRIDRRREREWEKVRCWKLPIQEAYDARFGFVYDFAMSLSIIVLRWAINNAASQRFASKSKSFAPHLPFKWFDESAVNRTTSIATSRELQNDNTNFSLFGEKYKKLLKFFLISNEIWFRELRLKISCHKNMSKKYDFSKKRTNDLKRKRKQSRTHHKISHFTNTKKKKKTVLFNSYEMNFCIIRDDNKKILLKNIVHDSSINAHSDALLFWPKEWRKKTTINACIRIKLPNYNFCGPLPNKCHHSSSHETPGEQRLNMTNNNHIFFSSIKRRRKKNNNNDKNGIIGIEIKQWEAIATECVRWHIHISATTFYKNGTHFDNTPKRPDSTVVSLLF